MAMTPRHKVGDRVWTGWLTRGKHNEFRVSIFEREIVSVMPKYLGGRLRYGAISLLRLESYKASARKTGEPLSRFGVAYKPEQLFDTEDAARMNVREQIEQERRVLNKLLGELPYLEPGQIHERTA